MGGDNAPKVVVQGLQRARVRYPDIRYLLFGDEGALKRLLDRRLSEIVEIRHTDQVIAADDKPSKALRKGTRSSMRLAIDAVRDGAADAVVSAGNTGALMALSKFSLRTLPGIYRPAIASYFPTLQGESVMLDLGANIQCDEHNLVQFAVMGANFAHTALGRVRPTVGLLNVGEEELKGNDTVRAAHQILRRPANFGFDYHGFVEGTDITKGTVDVIVTDGFTGNVALKTAEGTASLISDLLRQSIQSSWFSRFGYFLAKRSFAALRERLDPSTYNGGVFLGLNGVVVKSHGGTDSVGFANAIGLAVDLVQADIIGRIRNDFKQAAQAFEQAPKTVFAGRA